MKRLTIDEIADRVRPSRSTVARILKRARLSRLRNLDPKEPPNRYEYPTPGGLLHLDIKRLGRIQGVGKRFGGRPSARRAGWEYVHLAIDDHSRPRTKGCASYCTSSVGSSAGCYDVATNLPRVLS